MAVQYIFVYVQYDGQHPCPLASALHACAQGREDEVKLISHTTADLSKLLQKLLLF